MSRKIKSVIHLILTMILFKNLLAVFNRLEGQLYPYQNHLAEIYQEVQSGNLVTGIYLDYRLYDSIFEATILFVVATGIIFMVKKDADMIDQIQVGASRLFGKSKDR